MAASIAARSKPALVAAFARWSPSTLDGAVPQHGGDSCNKVQRAALKLRHGAEPGQAVDIELMRRDLQRCHILHDRVGAGKRNEILSCLATRLELSTT